MIEGELKTIIGQHIADYPAMEVQDMIKLLYQNEFGGGHFVVDEKASLARLKEENATAHEQNYRTEPIGNGLVRLYLGGNIPVSLPTINKIFIESANSHKGTTEGLQEKLEILLSLCKDKLMPFSYEKALEEITSYASSGYPMMSHSGGYRKEYRPAYRVVEKEFADYLSLFAKIEEKSEQNETFTVAVEGGCTAGKSTLAQNIQCLYDCNVFHLDDYFLRSEQRTPARLAEIGGNVDYERFDLEIVGGILTRQGFTFTPFDCKIMDYSPARTAIPKKLTIIEGVYSAHPKLTPIYDWLVFLDIPADLQKKRLEQRNSPEMVERFVTEWIPKENDYFSKFSIKSKANALYLQTE